MQVEEYIKLESQLARARKKFNVDTVRPLFDAVLSHGVIKKIYWKQCAPSFNDGEPCYFSVWDPEMATTEDDMDEDDKKYLAECIEDENEQAFWDEYEGPAFDRIESAPELNEPIDRLLKLFEIESLCEKVFGDGHQIIATWDAEKKRTEFEIDTYYEC
jgi:hypothetical protein